VNIILFGPPGAGKGTQAKYLVKKLNGFQISTGDILRNEINNNTEIGKMIVNDMNEGRFISDEIVNKLIKKIVSNPENKNKLIFDGYPRSLSQAENLENLLDITNQRVNFIFFLNVDKEIVIRRIEKRKTIEKRTDDEFKTILTRYDKYMDITRPVLDFYSKKANFHEIDGSQEIDQITSKINAFINV
tara:strand:- start:65 stop:628 length:564 start_codon:yes stop_codon:yes gene_type:complete